MSYKNKEDQKEFARKWYIKNKERLISKAKKNNKIYWRRNRDFLDKTKLERGCADCGYNKSQFALDFDHLRDKKINLAQLARQYVSIESLKKEIEKCEVVCSNCHRIRTYNRLMAKR